ncbi:MAG: uroporphyrinogen-III synthase [Phycisphaerae bacterium]|nr:uroporphyrinogen-III synthase [Gemmatimonadaceae bacterium]
MRRVTESSASRHDRDLTRALAMQRIIVTRGLAAGDRLLHRLGELGANVVHCPCVAMRPPHDEAPLIHAARDLTQYDWLLFTSANAVNAFSERVATGDTPISALPIAVGTVGSATAAVARALGWRVVFSPVHSSGYGLATELPVVSGQRILLPRADIASADMPSLLRNRGCHVTDVVAYRTVDAVTEQTVALLREVVHVDAITFTSPSTVRYLLAAALRAGWNVAQAQRERQLCIVCIGETTADELRRHGLQPDTVARDQSADGLIEALASCLHTRSGNARPGSPALWSH